MAVVVENGCIGFFRNGGATVQIKSGDTSHGILRPAGQSRRVDTRRSGVPSHKRDIALTTLPWQHASIRMSIQYGCRISRLFITGFSSSVAETRG